MNEPEKKHTSDCNVSLGFKRGEICNCHGLPGRTGDGDGGGNTFATGSTGGLADYNDPVFDGPSRSRPEPKREPKPHVPHTTPLPEKQWIDPRSKKEVVRE